MVYLTGDTHGSFARIGQFAQKVHLSSDDVLIILGDAGLNYYQNKRDIHNKRYVQNLGFTVFCIHGNHEIRPQNISTYKTKKYCGGQVMYEHEYPNILFAIDGEIYEFAGNRCLVIGGAYSVDKPYRLLRGYGWWDDEQPSDEIKRSVEASLERVGWDVDIVLTHTCPIKYEPTEVFLPFVDQSTVDKSTEEWLGTIEERLSYQRWYCGHFHTIKSIDRLRFLFQDYAELPDNNPKVGGSHIF